MSYRISQNLNARLAIAITSVILIFGFIAGIILTKNNQAYEHKISQTIHVDLAQHIVDEYLLFKDGKPDHIAAKSSFHNLMVLGPNFEFYLLDKLGHIVSYSSDPSLVKLKSVNLQPINYFIQQSSITKAILGDDPKNPVKKKVFSAAPIFNMGEVYGYLYVVIGSEARDKIEQSFVNTRLLESSVILLIIATLAAAIVAMLVVTWITKPLKTLTSQVKTISDQGFKNFDKNISKKSGLDRWNALSDNDIDIVGTSFRQAIERLEDQYQHIVSIDELRKELLSHLSHDLRTPLASLLGYLETWEIQQKQISEEQGKEYIATARKSAQKIVVLVDQLFDLANLDSNNVTVIKESVSVAELVQDVLQKFRLIAEEKNISLSIHPKDSSIEVIADIEKLERVFVNLIENAIRHTPKDGKVTVNLKKDASLVSIEVTDNGIGIPEQDLPHIFDPHFKAGNSVRENTAHGGLGLAITKRLLELHQSDIHVRSVLDRGTTFSFCLATASSSSNQTLA